MAPYRLKGAFVLGPTDPKDRSLAIHFSQSAASCAEFLEGRRASRTLLITDPDHPEDPVIGPFEVKEADPERGVRARLSYQGSDLSYEVPYGTLSEEKQIWEGSFVAAGCGRVTDPGASSDETHAHGGAHVKLSIAGETIQLTAAALTDYYDPLVDADQVLGDRPPLSPKSILARPPKWRLLHLSADRQYCLSRTYFRHGAAGLELDPTTNEVIGFGVSSERLSLDVKKPKVKIVWNDGDKGEFVSLSIEARGQEGGVAYSLSGTARPQRCN